MKYNTPDVEFSLIEDMLYNYGGPKSNSTTSTDDERLTIFGSFSVNSDDFNPSFNCTTSTKNSDIGAVKLNTSTTNAPGNYASNSANVNKLEEVRHHPLFSVLQNELVKECAPETSKLPYSLLGSSMPDEEPAETNTTTVNEQVALQDAAIRQEFASLQKDKMDDVTKLMDFYTRESEKLENERYRALCANIYYASCKKSVNSYYDSEHLVLIERVWKSLELFKQAVQCDSGILNSSGSFVDIKFEVPEVIAESSGVSMVNCCSRESLTKATVADLEKAIDRDVSSDKLDDMGAPLNISSSDSDNQSNEDSKTRTERSVDNVTSRKTITPEITRILLDWYNQNFDHPYPSDETVLDLATRGGVSERQVKKWFANKRVRSFNTLSFNGAVHPTKLRREGKRHNSSTSPEGSQTKVKLNAERSLDSRVVSILNSWYHNHLDHPYPSQEEKLYLANAAGITIQQLKSWFNNKRNRTGNTRRLVPHYFAKLMDKDPAAAVGVLQRKRKMLPNAPEYAKQPCLVQTNMPYQLPMPMYPSPSPLYYGHSMPMMPYPIGHM